MGKSAGLNIHDEVQLFSIVFIYRGPMLPRVQHLGIHVSDCLRSWRQAWRDMSPPLFLARTNPDFSQIPQNLTDQTLFNILTHSAERWTEKELLEPDRLSPELRVKTEMLPNIPGWVTVNTAGLNILITGMEKSNI